MKRRILCAVLVLGLTLSLAACGEPPAGEQFQELARAGKYQEAATVYSEQIQGDLKLEKEAEDFVDSWAQELGADFCDADLQVSKETLLEYECFEYTYGVVKGELSPIYALKGAVEFCTAGSYVEALGALESLDTGTGSAKTVFQAARRGYLDELQQEITRQLQERDPEQARYELEFAQSVLPDEPEISMIYDRCLDDYREFVLKNADEKLAGKDYAQTLLYLQEGLEVLPEDSQLTKALKNAQKQLLSETLDAVKAACAEHDYGKALIALDEAMALLPENETLATSKSAAEAEQADYIRRTTPISLTELEPFHERELETDKNVKDIFGNVYSLTLAGGGGFSTKEDSYGTYRIDGIYKTFTGTIFIKTKSYIGSPSSTRRIAVYGDDVLLYEVDYTCGDEVIPLELDITGVRDLKIVFGHSNLCLAYIGDPVLTP